MSKNTFRNPCYYFLFLVSYLVFFTTVNAEDPYKHFTWTITYGVISPLGVAQQGILINGQFPGPDIYAVTNDNLVINVINNLPDPFLITWNGIQQKRNSWEDGVSGTNCPIPPGGNFTYNFQVKDQIGSFFYFPSLAFHRAAGGFGAIRIASRPLIPVPFPEPAEDYTVLIGDWYAYNHRDILDTGRIFAPPDGILINGLGSNRASFRVEEGKTYRLRISNVGLRSSLSFSIGGHSMKLVEVEGTHTTQNTYTWLEINVGQSCSVLVTADQPAEDYYILVATCFSRPQLSTVGILHYSNAANLASGPVPRPPADSIGNSILQARSIRTNLTASGPRPNPQGSYHYGTIPINRIIRLANSAASVNGSQRYAINSVSYIEPDTPLKLADHFKIQGVFSLDSILDHPTGSRMHLNTSVMNADFRSFVEIVFENDEEVIQSYHLDGYSFFVVGMARGNWQRFSRQQYNLRDAVSRCTVQVYPHSWTAIRVALDNVGMWNVRSENWVRNYLGQQLYLRVYSPAESERDEYPIPTNVLLCGRAVGN